MKTLADEEARQIRARLIARAAALRDRAGAMNGDLAARHELEQVEFVLQRFEEDSFGLCVDCGVPIAPSRLRAAPQAPRCGVCARES